jgi:regulatory protein
MKDPADTTFRNAMASALRILARRDHSVVELNQKLDRRGYAQDTVQQVVVECSRLGYLNDQRVAGQLIDRMKRRSMGLRRIRHELQKRGMEGDRVEAQLLAGVSPSEERLLVRQAAEKKWKLLSGKPDSRNKMLRLQRFPPSRRFSDSIIVETLKEMHL